MAEINNTMLYLAVTAKKAADAVADRQLSEVLRDWAMRAVDGCAFDEVPQAELDMLDVELLLAAMSGPQTIDRLVEEVESSLKAVWRSVYGFGVEIPWTVESYNVRFVERDGAGITVKQKTRTPTT